MANKKESKKTPRYFVLEVEAEELKLLIRACKCMIERDKTVLEEEPTFRWYMTVAGFLNEALLARQGEKSHRFYVGNQMTFITIPRLIDI